MYCKQCGYLLDISASSCPNCGTAKGFGDGFCQNCGTPRIEQNNFCASCGFSFVQTGTDINNEISSFGGGGNIQPVNVQSYQFSNIRQYADDTLTNVKAVLAIPDKIKMLGRYIPYAAAVLIFFFMWFYAASLNKSLLGTYAPGNVFAVSGFSGTVYLLAFFGALATFLPHTQSFIANNKKLEPFVYMIVPFLELVGLMGLFIGIGVLSSQISELSGYSYGFTFTGWLVILLSLAGVCAAVFHFIKYDLPFVKANNPFVNSVGVGKYNDSISNAMNGDTYQNTVYRGDDMK